MNIFQQTKLSPDVQEELVEYGILRDAVKGESKKKSEGKGTNFIGVQDTTTEYKLYTVENLEKNNFPTGGDITLSVVAPDYEAFDMISSEDFSSRIKGKDEKSLKAFLMKLIDSVHI